MREYYEQNTKTNTLHTTTSNSTLFNRLCKCRKRQKVTSEQTVTLDGTQSSPDFFGEIKKHKWKQVKAREKGNKHLKVTLLDNKSASPSFVAPTVSKETTLTFRLVTTEKDGMYSPWRSRDSVDVLVSPKVTTNIPPEALATSSSSAVKEGNTVTFDASTSSDSDGHIVAYEWKDAQGTVLSQEVSFEHIFATLGEQTLILTVTDDGGETATATVTVNVVALQKPKADINTSASTIFINDTVSFDASASNDTDGQIVSYAWKDTQGSTLSNQVSFTHAFAVSGEHNITLEVLDDDGQLSTASVTIVVQAHLTSLTLTIEESTLEVNQTTTLTAIAHYNDNTNQEVSSSVSWVVADTTLVNIDANGTLKALDSGTTNMVAHVGNIDSNSVTLEVLALDTTPPTLTLNDESELTLLLGTAYTELGARVTDDRDDNVTITQSGTVDVNNVGTYSITYTAIDKAGNESSITRTVHVVLPPDVTPPVLTLNGQATMTLHHGTTYTELGATANDERDGSVPVTITGNVETTVSENYTVTYTAQDSVDNQATTTRNITVLAPALTSISLESNVTTLNVGERAELTVMGTYSDGHSKAVNANIEYVITPSDSVDVNGSVLTAKKDGDITVQAKVGSTLSNILTLNITWIVNGHVLPPEPDKTLNDSTLLGIDVNDNGVRDDVERWIYEKYKDKHPIHIDIGMQTGRAYKLVLEHPEKAKEIHNIVSAPVFCEGYFRVFADMFGDTKYIQKKILDTQFDNIYFNISERTNAYLQYQQYLSGDIYLVPRPSKGKNFCDFDISKF